MKILIVDDEPRHLRGMVNLIRQLRPNADVMGAKDGIAALEQARQVCPQVILTDIRMPRMDGLAFLERLKAEGILTRVIMVSAYNLFEYAQRAIRHGAYDYLLKPIEIESVERLLDRLELELHKESLQRREEEERREQLTGTLSHPSIPVDSEKLFETLQNKNEIIVANCLRWMREHVKEELTLERVAAHFFFNPSYFSTFIKSKTGSTFSEHVTAIRMERAKELLAENALKIYEISAECGYQDTKYFCRVFKKHYGLSPEAYKHTSLPERKGEV